MKSGSMFLIMVLLTVLAIPLFANHVLGNTVGKFSAMSTMNNKKEVPLRDIASPYREITGIPPKVPLYKEWLPLYTDRSMQSVPIEKIDVYIPRFMQRCTGGARRIKSGRH